MEASLVTLMSLEKILNVKITQLREKAINPNQTSQTTTSIPNNVANSNDTTLPNQAPTISTEDTKYVKEFLIRKDYTETDDFIEVRVAVVGNVDSGKSTLLGVLTHSILDDGRGEARCKLFRHKHEIETGRTSSVGNDILGFDSSGHVINDDVTHHHTAANNIVVSKASLEWESICKRSSKVLTFIDLAGHEKYLKTTVFGMTGLAPDFCMLMVKYSICYLTRYRLIL